MSKPRRSPAVLALTLFMVVAEWFGPDRMEELIAARTGRILTARVAVPHAGWP